MAQFSTFLFGSLAILVIFVCNVTCLQFPWAMPIFNATESTISVFDLRRPEFPASQVEMFLNQTVAGRDYPDYHTIPVTNFTCQSVEGPGFYSDPETGCQIYHRCAPDGTKYDYMCGEQTIFDQLLLTCDFFYKVDCSKAVGYFNYANIHLYQKGENLQPGPKEGGKM